MKTLSMLLLPALIVAAWPLSWPPGATLRDHAAQLELASSHCPQGKVWDAKRKKCVRVSSDSPPRGSN